MPHGRDDLEWNDLVEAGYGILTSRAPLQEMLDYTAFARMLAGKTGQPVMVFPQDRNAVGHLLADISRRGFEDHPKLLLSVLVYARAGGRPGRGFFDLARDQDLITGTLSTEEEDVFVYDQVRKLADAYRKRPARS